MGKNLKIQLSVFALDCSVAAAGWDLLYITLLLLQDGIWHRID